jgi:hypothetical protein
VSYTLGAVNPAVDMVECNSKFPPGPGRDACMIGKGYYQSSPGHWEHHSGISPATAVAAGLALVGLPIAVKAVVKGIEGLTSSSTPAPQYGPPASAAPAAADISQLVQYGPPAPAPQYGPPAPAPQYGPPASAAPPPATISQASIVPPGFSPWILVLGAVGILFAMSRKGGRHVRTG